MVESSSKRSKDDDNDDDKSKEEQNDDNKNRNNDAVQKAKKFWQHPSLQGISSDEKLKYLHSKGITDEQIHLAWDEIVRQGDQQQQRQETQYRQPNHPNQQQPQPAPPYAPAPPYYQNSNMQSYHYDPSNYNHSGYYNEEEEQSPGNTAAVLTLGGMIGLGAAAAYRWLNGGDFQLFPPPTLRESSSHPHVERSMVQNQQLEEEARVAASQQQEEEEEHFSLADEYERQDDELVAPAAPQGLIRQLEQLTLVMQGHVESQDRLVKQLMADKHKDITDSSMNLLRPPPVVETDNHGQQNSSSLLLLLCWSELVELRAQLTTLSIQNNRQSNLDSSPQEDSTKLEHVLDRVSNGLQQLEKLVGIIHDETDQGNNNTTNDSPTMTRKTDSTTSSPSSTNSSGSSASQRVEIAAVHDQDDGEHQGSLQGAIEKLVTENEITELRGGAQLLYLYALNLSSHPNVPRYRKIYTNNANYHKVEALTGGRELLTSIGFSEKGSFLEWQGEEGDDECMTRVQEAAAALSILKSPQQQADAQVLLNTALSVLSLPVRTSTTTTTPLRHSTTLSDATQQPEALLDNEDAILQTPQPNVIVSPPSTKRGASYLTDFPEPPMDLNESHCSEETSNILDISSASLELRPLPAHHVIDADILNTNTGYVEKAAAASEEPKLNGKDEPPAIQNSVKGKEEDPRDWSNKDAETKSTSGEEASAK